jgi:hypothetical protein
MVHRGERVSRHTHALGVRAAGAARVPPGGSTYLNSVVVNAGERDVGVVTSQTRRLRERLATRIQRRLFGDDGKGASNKVKAALP